MAALLYRYALRRAEHARQILVSRRSVEGRKRAGRGIARAATAAVAGKKAPGKARISDFRFLSAWKNGKSFRKQIEFWLEPKNSDAILYK
jgi:hypothetical protein